ncbi:MULTISPECIES: hypothetical protein [Rodentibacter]|uniref:hypothetical protein n=1 Tax=Rodentibacter TaxID=1960084 RepID=UPI001CFCFF7C|nr:hypothetical protein [Rodentibacter sp. JRC1]GJI55796.1 hypothetical protein HEMROJRC1_09080 [Rodentibacter sp. JRC1]
MRKLVSLWLLSFLLFGCTTTDRKEVSKQTEVIRAFFIANNSVYAIGDLNSYQFSSSKSSDVQFFIEFLNSQYMKAFKSARISSIERNIEDNKIEASISIELDNKKLAESKKEEISTRYDVYKSTQGNPDLYFEITNGEILKLQNRDEILSKGKLSTPLRTNFIEYKTSTKFDFKETKEGLAMGVVWGGVGIIMIPFAIISLPFQAVDMLSK